MGEITAAYWAAIPSKMKARLSDGDHHLAEHFA